MLNINKVNVGGRLAFDPELKSTKLGASYCEVSVATERTIKDDKSFKKETTFIRVTIWGKQSENVCQYLNKGSQIYIEGRVKVEQWEKEGRKQSRMIIIADNVQFVDPKKAYQPREDEQPRQSAPTPEDFGCDEEIPF